MPQGWLSMARKKGSQQVCSFTVLLLNNNFSIVHTLLILQSHVKELKVPSYSVLDLHNNQSMYAV